jgi:hypothetical protein
MSSWMESHRGHPVLGYAHPVADIHTCTQQQRQRLPRHFISNQHPHLAMQPMHVHVNLARTRWLHLSSAWGRGSA